MKRDRVLILAADYSTMEQVVERIFTAFPRPWQGKKVLLKPNVIGWFDPERHITTHPSLVVAVARHLHRVGARVEIGDNPGRMGYGENELCFAKAGLLGELAPFYRNIGLAGRRTEVRSGKHLRWINVSREVLEADYVISLPKFKTHQLCVLSGAVKNSFGFLVGGDKAEAHRLAGDAFQFAEMLVDVYQFRPPDLIVMDAVVGMEGEGPTGRRLRPDVGRILASENGVSLDAVMAKMMGMQPELVPMLAEANRRGLGEITAAAISVEGEFRKLDRFRKPLCYQGPWRFYLRNFFLTRVVFGGRVRLRANPARCTSCLACQRICPAEPKAVEVIAAGIPPCFNRDSCRECFCCMEVCPEQAIEKRSPFGSRLFRRVF